MNNQKLINKYFAKKLKCPIRIRIQVREKNDKFKDKLRIDVCQYSSRKIYIKYQGREEITTLAEFLKRGKSYLKKLILKTGD